MPRSLPGCRCECQSSSPIAARRPYFVACNFSHTRFDDLLSGTLTARDKFHQVLCRRHAGFADLKGAEL
jgi:hypothetical protein